MNYQDPERPPAGGFGAQPVAQAAFGPMQRSAVHAGAKPLPQSAFVVGILPVLIAWFGSTALNIIGSLIELYMLMSIGQLGEFACVVWYAMNAMRALEDLRRTSNNPAFLRWPTLIPIFGSIYWLTSVPAEVRKAKEMHGLPATNRNLLLYLLFPVFAIQRDLNDFSIR